MERFVTIGVDVLLDKRCSHIVVRAPKTLFDHALPPIDYTRNDLGGN